LIIYSTVGNLIDWEQAVKLDLTHHASPVFDATNKLFKEYHASMYFYECDEDSITLKRLCLVRRIVDKVHTYPIKNV